MFKKYASVVVISLFASQVAQANVVESFDSGAWGSGWINVDHIDATVDARAAHDGPFGVIFSTSNLVPTPLTVFGPDLILNAWAINPGIVFGLGQILSAWVHPRSFSEDVGRAEIGFAADSAGAYSLVAATNTAQLVFQENNFIGVGGARLNSVPYTFGDQWYKVTIARSADGTSATGSLFDSDGVTLLRSVTQTGLSRTATGIALRGWGQNDVDTISISAVPEPETYAMLLAGLGAMGLMRSRKLLKATSRLRCR